MEWLARSLRENPELAVFLTLVIGFVIGGLPQRGALESADRRASPRLFAGAWFGAAELRAYVDHNRLRTTLDSHDRADRES
jgi:hypothetical protein